jgi:uncharacterized protein
MISSRCPICQKAMSGASDRKWPAFPFCSSKCRLVDLGRWLGEGYGLPANPDPDEQPEIDDDTSDPP